MLSVLAGRGYWGTIIEKYMPTCDFNNTGIFMKSSSISWSQMCTNSETAFICTPVSTHYQFVKEALEAGCHVFCEKMLTCNLKQAKELYEIATWQNRILFTDYIYLFSPSIKKLKELFSLLRGNIEISMDISQQGKFYSDVDVMGNIGVHMLSVFGLLTDFSPYKISSYDINAAATESNLSICSNNVHGNIHASIVSNQKIRQIKITGDNGYMTFDMMNHIPLKAVINSTSFDYMYDENNNLTNSLNTFRENILQNDYLQNYTCSLYLEQIIAELKK